jgi:hypothetical protein
VKICLKLSKSSIGSSGTDNYKADISAEVKQISTVAVSRFEREFKILRFHKNMTHFYYRLNYVDQANMSQIIKVIYWIFGIQNIPLINLLINHLTDDNL